MDSLEQTFQTKLRSWVPLRAAYHSQFSPAELDIFRKAEQAFNSRSRIVVFLSLENQYAALGGLATVTSHLPTSIWDSGENVIFLTPFHREHPAVKKALAQGRFKKVVPQRSFRGCGLRSTMTCYQDMSVRVPSVYVDIQGFFSAKNNPYDYTNKSLLLADSLAFCASAPAVLVEMGHRHNLLFHAQDWETAPIALTSRMELLKGTIASAKTVLTLHNSFDSALPLETMLRFLGREFSGHTVLQCCVPLLSGPLTAVSTPFANELRHDPIQKGYFATHLQSAFSQNPPIGIENGPFGAAALPFTKTCISAARRGDTGPVVARKKQLRAAFVRFLRTKTHPAIVGKLRFAAADANAPIFFMTGRLDLMQKGFDVVFDAFARLKRGTAKLFFSPTLALAQSEASLSFFVDIIEHCGGDITMWPFRLTNAEYARCLRGSSFLVMPSFYEPFGAATEGYLNGTPVVARATGGLLSQVVPEDAGAIPARYRALLPHNSRPIAPTGVLYREKYADDKASSGWREVLSSAPGNRMSCGLYRSMVDAAHVALKSACEIHADARRYGLLVAGGISMLERFSWKSTVDKYRMVYDAATRHASV